MARVFVAILFVLACLFVATNAVPITDVSATYVGVSEEETSPTSESFTVSVSRVDDLLDTEGNLVAERVMAVAFNFELQDDELLVNNVPVALGISSVATLEAEIMYDVSTEEQVEDLHEAFGVGLVTVEVTTEAVSVATDVEGVLLRRITIWTRVVEVDGKEVVQIDAVEKIIEVKVTDPAFLGESLPASETPVDEQVVNDLVVPGPLVASDTSPEPVKKPCPQNTLGQKIAHWWRCSSLPAKIFVSSASLTVLFALFFVAIPAAAKAIANRRCCRVAYETVEQEAVCEEKTVTVDEEKLALMDSVAQ